MEFYTYTYFTYFSFNFLLALFSLFILYVMDKKNIVANYYFKNKNHNEKFLHQKTNHYIRKIYNKSKMNPTESLVLSM